MSRSSPHADPKSMDEDIRSLMEDIDASLVDFERRLAEELVRHGRCASARPSTIARPGLVFPEIEPTLPSLPGVVPVEPREEVAQPEPETEAGSAGPNEEAALDFLAQLEREANARNGNADDDAIRRAAEERLLDETLKRIFKFFEVLCRHSNTLAPTIKRTYRLDLKTTFPELRWQDASVRARRQSLAEKALLDYVAFRVSLVAAEPIELLRRRDQMDALNKEMHHFGLRTAEGLEVDLEEEVASGEALIRLAPDFVLQITFRANYRLNRIDVLTRNLEDFGLAAFFCAPADVTQTFLDDFARFLLDRSKQLPPALERILGRKEN